MTEIKNNYFIDAKADQLQDASSLQEEVTVKPSTLRDDNSTFDHILEHLSLNGEIRITELISKIKYFLSKLNELDPCPNYVNQITMYLDSCSHIVLWSKKTKFLNSIKFQLEPIKNWIIECNSTVQLDYLYYLEFLFNLLLEPNNNNNNNNNNNSNINNNSDIDKGSCSRGNDISNEDLLKFENCDDGVG